MRTAFSLSTGNTPGSPRSTGIGPGVRFAAKIVRRAREQLAMCSELNVNLEANNGLVAHCVLSEKSRWHLRVPVGELLIPVCHGKQSALAKVLANKLKPDG